MCKKGGLATAPAPKSPFHTLPRPASPDRAIRSRWTHATRLDTLRGQGIQQKALERISSPLRLIPSARDPATLALSAL